MRFILGLCAISPIRKNKQRQRMSLTFNKFNAFLIGINMFKVNKKNTRTRCEIYLKLTIKTPERRLFVIFVFNSKYISHLVLVLLKLALNNEMLVGVIRG